VGPDGSPVSGVAVALFFDRVDGQERVAGNPGVGGSSAAAASRTCHGGQVDRVDGSTRSIGPWYGVVVFSSESLALRRKRYRCMWCRDPPGVSLCYLPHTKAPDENPKPLRSW
jgi:hypothetical protein